MSYLLQDEPPLAIYIHVPFCAKHCAYCDFNTYVEGSHAPIVEQTVEAICRDIEATPGAVRRHVGTVFFGGGTPTFLSGGQLTRILAAVSARFQVDPLAEISSEANPGSSDTEKFAEMRAAGFNRLSIGVQSFDDDILLAIDRTHSGADAERALASARSAGFENISLDLMFGLPQQSMGAWQASLERAISCDVEHLSLYALTLEPGTRFERLHAGGKLTLPDEDTEADMYEESIVRLQSAGYEHYEVSNFARPGYRSRHNTAYWRNGEYLGFGPGAVSYLDGRRWKRQRFPRRYVEAVARGEDLTVEEERLDSEGSLGETMMLGLRLREGLSRQAVRARFGIDPVERFGEKIERLARDGLLVYNEERLILTHRGMLIANTVLAEFLAG